MRHPRFWGSLCIAVSAAGSNVGSAWAGWAARGIGGLDPWMQVWPPDVGFRVLGWTLYPVCIGLLVLGVWLWTKSGSRKE